MRVRHAGRLRVEAGRYRVGRAVAHMRGVERQSLEDLRNGGGIHRQDGYGESHRPDAFGGAGVGVEP